VKNKILKKMVINVIAHQRRSLRALFLSYFLVTCIIIFKTVIKTTVNISSPQVTPLGKIGILALGIEFG
jgi:hypothetical protein